MNLTDNVAYNSIRRWIIFLLLFRAFYWFMSKLGFTLRQTSVIAISIISTFVLILSMWMFYDRYDLYQNAVYTNLEVSDSANYERYNKYRLTRVEKKTINSSTSYSMKACAITSNEKHNVGDILTVYIQQKGARTKCRYSDYDKYPFNSIWDIFNSYVVMIFLSGVYGLFTAYRVYKNKPIFSHNVEAYVEVVSLVVEANKIETYEDRLKRYQITLFFFHTLSLLGLFVYEVFYNDIQMFNLFESLLILGIIIQYIFPKLYRHFVWDIKPNLDKEISSNGD